MTPNIQCSLNLPPHEGNPRNSEGSFVALKGGRLLFVYSHFVGSTNDDAEAYLAGRHSDDEGRTWSDEDAVVIPNPPGENIMSVSLLRLEDGRIALFYLHKEAHAEWPVLMRTSDDEAATWSEPTRCSTLPGLYVLNNDRAVQLDSGRIVLPVAHRMPEEGRAEAEGIRCLLSDDAGATWRPSQVRRVPDVWTQEPGVIALKDGRLMMWCRTQMGCQYVNYSDDAGETWSPLEPSRIVSSLSPASITRIPRTGDLLMVWNPVPGPWPGWDALIRSPLSSAISSDEGETWANEKVIYHDPAKWFNYTAFHFTADDHVLLAHGASGGKGSERVAHQQITRIPLSWFYD